MPDLTIDVEFWCARCGKGICHLATQKYGKQGFNIEPCPWCMSGEEEKGWEKGYEQAKKEFDRDA